MALPGIEGGSHKGRTSYSQTLKNWGNKPPSGKSRDSKEGKESEGEKKSDGKWWRGITNPIGKAVGSVDEIPGAVAGAAKATGRAVRSAGEGVAKGAEATYDFLSDPSEWGGHIKDAGKATGHFLNQPMPDLGAKYDKAVRQEVKGAFEDAKVTAAEEISGWNRFLFDIDDERRRPHEQIMTTLVGDSPKFDPEKYEDIWGEERDLGLVWQGEGSREQIEADAVIDILESAKAFGETAQTSRISNQDYDELNSVQRGLVVFNTMLDTALSKDLKSRYNPSKKEQQEYSATVNRVFGEGNDNTIFLPEVVALLDDMGFSDTRIDLGDFATRGLLARQGEIDLLADPKGGGSPQLPEGYSEDRLELLTAMAGQVNDLINRKITEGQEELLQSVQATLKQGRMDRIEALGGDPQLRVDPGYGPVDMSGFDENGKPRVDRPETYFPLALQALSLRQNQPQFTSILKDIQADLGDEGFESFRRYASARLQNASRFGGRVGPKMTPDNEQLDFRDPEQVLDDFLGGK